MISEVRTTVAFDAWLRGLKDKTSSAIIARRIRRVSTGNLGDTRSLGDGVSELRVHHGPG